MIPCSEVSHAVGGILLGLAIGTVKEVTMGMPVMPVRPVVATLTRTLSRAVLVRAIRVVWVWGLVTAAGGFRLGTTPVLGVPVFRGRA
jgi:hypothetical protein